MVVSFDVPNRDVSRVFFDFCVFPVVVGPDVVDEDPECFGGVDGAACGSDEALPVVYYALGAGEDCVAACRQVLGGDNEVGVVDEGKANEVQYGHCDCGSEEGAESEGGHCFDNHGADAGPSSSGASVSLTEAC